MTPEEAAAVVLHRRKVRKDFLSWTEHALAPFDQKPAAHHKLLIKNLQDVAEGKCDRLMVLMPPGSAKSTYSTVLFPCWWFAMHPRGQIISASYNQEKADEFSGFILPYIRDNSKTLGYTLNRERVQSWDISTRGTYRAVGMGGPVTGRRADLIIIDDPVKGQAEADSEKVRRTIDLWYSRDLYTRLKPGGAIIICQTRWHSSDLAGTLIEGMKEGKDQWRIINLPALAELGDPLGRAPGEALWPEWQNEKALARIRTQVGERGWSALYQQRPTAEEGSILKTTWWRPWTQPLPTAPDMTIVSLDLAYTAKNSNDPSACTVWDVTTGEDFRTKMLMRFAWSERLEFPDLIPALLETVNAYKRRYIPMRVLIEAKGPGLSVVQELRRRVPELNIFTVSPTTDKEARAHSVTGMFEDGVVYAPATLDDDDKPVFKPWVEMVMNECAAFPLGATDDLVDSVTQCLRHVRNLGFELHAEDAPPPARFVERVALY